MIKRIWRGWTMRENADADETLLHDEVFPGILGRDIPGLRGVSLLRRDGDDEVAFVTIMTLESLDSARALAGDQPTCSYVPDKARALLSRWDEHAEHYELREDLY